MLQTVFNILKVTAILAVAAIFLTAIINLVSFIQVVVFHNVIGEVFTLLSVCLPFNASVVFGSIGVVITAIFSFLISKKIFDLTSWSISTV